MGAPAHGHPAQVVHVVAFMLQHATQPSWQKLLSVEQAQMQAAIDEYVHFVDAARPATMLDDATHKLLLFLKGRLDRKGTFLQHLTWHSQEHCIAMSEAHERQCQTLEQAQRLYATLPYSTQELAYRVRDLVQRLQRDLPSLLD